MKFTLSWLKEHLETEAPLADILADEGYRVLEAEDGLGALQIIHSERPRLVILDIWMEEMSGLEVQGQLSALSPQTRVIIITGREDQTAKLAALQLGVIAFFTKPFDDDQFLNAVRGALAMHAIE